MALIRGRQREERWDKKGRQEEKRQGEGEMKLKGKVTARDKSKQGDSQAQNQKVRDNGEKEEERILNRHQRGKNCFETGLYR